MKKPLAKLTAHVGIQEVLPDPAKIESSGQWYFLGNISTGLVDFDHTDGRFKPLLAEKWESFSTGVHTFTLREDAKFQDGTPITSEDVIASIKRLLIKRTATHFRLWEYIEGCENLKDITQDCSGLHAVNHRTVEIRLKSPSESFFLQLASPETSIWNRKDIDEKTLELKPTKFSGPYAFTGFRDRAAILVRNEHKPIVGHGCDTDPSIASLKAAAELTERRLVVAYYQNSKEPIRNSNGWAVGISLERAKEAAMREALERHILTYTFLKSGWSDFVLLDRRESENGTLLFLASPYIQNDYFAGMVVYRDKRFSGVAFGYVADQAQSWQRSSRWNHAIFEAVAFVERIVETGGLKPSENPIYNACRQWLTTPWPNPSFKKSLEFTVLPVVSPEVRSGIDESSGLFFSQVKAGSFLPLFLNEDLVDPAKKAFISGVAQGRYGHKARKMTWLYAVGTDFPELNWGPYASPDWSSCRISLPSFLPV